MKKRRNQFKSAMSPSYLALKNKKSNKATPEKTSFFSRATSLLRNIEPWLVLVALTAFGVDLYGQNENREQWKIERSAIREERLARIEEQKAIQEERIARYWQVATAPHMSPSGRTNALNYLHKLGQKFYGIKINKGRLIEANLSKAIFEHADMKNMSFIQGNFNKVQFNSASLSGSSFLLSTLIGTDFTEANLTGGFIAIYKVADFSPNFDRTNVSDLLFILATTLGISRKNSDGVWERNSDAVWEKFSLIFEKSWAWEGDCPLLNMHIYGTFSICEDKVVQGIKIKAPIYIKRLYKKTYERYQKIGFPDKECLSDLMKGIESERTTRNCAPRYH